MLTLIIAEKPSVARDIARVLQVREKHEGFLSSGEYLVTWALGHLVTLCEPGELDERWQKWTRSDLPMLPGEIRLKAVERTRAQLKVVTTLMKRKDVGGIICATDAGREGELIFRHIVSLTGTDKPARRLWISSMTDEAIREGFASLRPIEEYDNLYRSAKSRAEADWLVGMNASRAYSLRYSARISVGRVQTPTLMLLVKRRREIEQFKSKDYLNIKVQFTLDRDPAQRFEALWEDAGTNESAIYDEEKAKAIAKKVRGKAAKAEKIEITAKKEPPPQLYNLSELQRAANRIHGFSAKKTLDVAQVLYERHKLITYPRTDSRYITKDIAKTLPALKASMERSPFAELLPNATEAVRGARVVNDARVSDHHALLPTLLKRAPSTLSADELKIYSLICRRFLAQFYPDYEYERTKVISICEGECFVTNARRDIALGWKQAEGERAGAEETSLPLLREGEPLRAEQVNIKRLKTKPPPQHNEATLLAAMEHIKADGDNDGEDEEKLKELLKISALGTSATRAAIIERLIEVGYVRRAGKSLIATDKGMSLIDVLPPEITDPVTTGKWERALELIARGEMPPERFIASIHRFCSYLVTSANTARSDVRFEREAPKGKKRMKKTNKST